MDELLRDILSHLHEIQTSYKGSIGGMHNVYLPQLDVERVGKLEARIVARLEVCDETPDLP